MDVGFIIKKMVKVIQDKCIGCGVCPLVCEDVFELREDGKAYIKEGKENANDDLVKEAKDACPVEAIEI